MSQWPPALEDAHAALLRADRRYEAERTIDALTALLQARDDFDTAIVEHQFEQRKAVLDEVDRHRQEAASD